MKAFRLRGFRGHAQRPAPKGVPLSEVRAPSGAARYATQAAYANKRRVTTMTGGVDRRVARLFAPNASFLRVGGQAKKVQKVKSKKPAPLDLSRALARFRRFGELPDAKPEVIAALPRHSGINGSLLKKMIQAMLVRAGVEQNPGPDRFCACGCPLAGRFVKPEFVRIRGKKHWKCPSCACELGRQEGPRRLHPRACEEDAPTASLSPMAGVSTMEVVQPVVPRVCDGCATIASPSSKAGTSTMEVVQPVAPRDMEVASQSVAPSLVSLSGPPSDDRSDGGSTPVDSASVDSAAESYRHWRGMDSSGDDVPHGSSGSVGRGTRPPRGQARKARASDAPGRAVPTIVPPPVQVQAPVPIPTPVPAAPPKPVVAPAPGKHRLDGQVIDEDDKLTILSRLVGRPVYSGDMSEEDVVLPYGGERRIATSRNIKEITADMRICQFGCEHWAFQWARFWLCCLCFAFSGLFFSLRPLAQFPAFTFIAVFVDWCPFASLVLGQVSLWAIPFILPKLKKKHTIVAYVPHLVSAVLFEYDRNMDADAVRASIRQKFRRMSCLPIPDYDLIKFVSGSEVVCEHILRSQNFFGEGAASFLLPS